MIFPQTQRAPPGIRLQPRDVELLRIVFNHRFIRSDHLQQLVIPTVSRRIIQTRLQKLSAHGYLKRLYVPVVLDGEHAPPIHSRQPIYILTKRGARLLAERSDAKADAELPGRTSGLPSQVTLLHHLVVTDFLVALTSACRRRIDVDLIRGEHEGLLWQRLREYRKQHRARDAVVPDGAFTLRYPSTGEELTFYLEVVRADVKGGNRRLLDKLKRYVELHRQGFFRNVYGHQQLRAVLLATTSTARAKNFLRLAGQLAHGRRLFWFGVYQEQAADGRLVSCFTPERVLMGKWWTVDGSSQLLSDAAPR